MTPNKTNNSANFQGYLNQNAQINTNNSIFDTGIKVKEESFSERKLSLRKPKNKGKYL